MPLRHVRLFPALFRVSGQLFRTSIVGTVGSGVNLLVLTVLVEFIGIYYLFVAFIAYLSNLFVCFTGDRLWTYRVGRSRMARRFVRYVLTYSVTMGLKLWLLAFLVESVSMHYLLSQTIAIAVGGGLSFIVYRTWVFSSRSQ